MASGYAAQLAVPSSSNIDAAASLNVTVAMVR
jgi:hypothetical protein